MLSLLLFAPCVKGDYAYGAQCARDGLKIDLVRIVNFPTTGLTSQSVCCGPAEQVVNSTKNWLPSRQPICLGQQYNSNVFGAKFPAASNQNPQPACVCAAPYVRRSDGTCGCCAGQKLITGPAVYNETSCANGVVELSTETDVCACDGDQGFARVGNSTTGFCIQESSCTFCPDGSHVGFVTDVCQEKNCQGLPVTRAYPWGYTFCPVAGQAYTPQALLQQVCVCDEGYTRDVYTKQCVQTCPVTSCGATNACGIVSILRPANYQPPQIPPPGTLYSPYNAQLPPTRVRWPFIPGFNPYYPRPYLRDTAKTTLQEQTDVEIKNTANEKALFVTAFGRFYYLYPIYLPIRPIVPILLTSLPGTVTFSGRVLKPPCSCDRLCAAAGDCCSDFPQKCPSICPCTYIRQPTNALRIQSNCLTYYFRVQAEPSKCCDSALCLPTNPTAAPTPKCTNPQFC